MRRVIFVGAGALLVLFFTVGAMSFDYNRAVNLSGKQRMLSQKMSKEALFVGLGVDVEENLKNLIYSREAFSRALKGLEHGDKLLGLDPVENKEILEKLNRVAWLWKPLNDAVDKALEKEQVDKLDVDAIALTNLPLLQEMDKTVKMYEEDAVRNGVSSYIAVAINLSGRQRMLTQKMTKEFLLIAIGHNVEKNKKELKKTISLFDKTIHGLIYGDLSVGLAPVVDNKVKDQLLLIEDLWQDFKLDVEKEPTVENAKLLAEKNLVILDEMNKAVYLYEEITPSGFNLAF